MSHGGDDTAACCILGVCCRKGGRKQAEVLAESLRTSASDSTDRVRGPFLAADALLKTYQLVPLDLLEGRPEFAQRLDLELRGYLERRGVVIKAEAET